MHLEPGHTLTHYRLIEKIGAGGMGVVWKATDTTLGRDVAVKVLPADLALDPTRRKMFTDEAKLASRLTDAHIAQVHELGHEDGTDFIVMEYVDGQPLDRYVEGSSPSPEKVADLGEQVARALSRAHKKGLIHRDLKPGNILVTGEGEVKVVDFGLATLFERADETMLTQAPTQSMSEAPTEVGAPKSLMGTIPYMSPEQVRLEKLDGRSDIFSLGSVLYEMATGQMPFVAPTAGELMQEVRKARPTPVRELEPSMPPELETIVSKAMAAKKEDRYQHAEDLAVDLKRLNRQLETGTLPSVVGVEEQPVWSRPSFWTAAAVVLIAALVALVVTKPWIPATDPGTILILPATTELTDADEGLDYVAWAFAQTIAMNLATAKELKVLRVPKAGEDGGTADPHESAREQGAGRVLRVSMAPDGETLRAALSLEDVKESRLLWGAERETSRQDAGRVAPELAREVMSKLGLSRRKLYDWWETPTQNPELARSPLYIETMAALQQRNAAVMASAAEKLIAEFPDEPDALVLALEAFGWRDAAGEPGFREKTEATLAELLRVDPDGPWGLRSEADRLSGEGRAAEAFPLYERLLARDDLTPLFKAMIRGLSVGAVKVLTALDREEGFREYEEAVRVNPANAELHRSYADLLWFREPEKAVGELRLAKAIVPMDPQIDFQLGHTLLMQDRWDESLRSLELLCNLWQHQRVCGMHAFALHRSGRVEEALQAAEAAEAAEAKMDDRFGTMYLARYRAAIGDVAAAVRLLERHVAASPRPMLLWGHEDLDRLAGDPELERLIEADWRRAAAFYQERCAAGDLQDQWFGGAGRNLGQVPCAIHALALHMSGEEDAAREAAAAAAAMDDTWEGSEYLAWYHSLLGDRGEVIRLLQLRDRLPDPYWPPLNPVVMSPRPERHRDFAWLRGDPEFDALAVFPAPAGAVDG